MYINTITNLSYFTDDIDTDLYRSIAAKVTEANGDDMDNKKFSAIKLIYKYAYNIHIYR